MVNRMLMLGTVAFGLASGTAAYADTLITSFDNFSPSSYGSWSPPTITSGPTSFTVASTGFGGGFWDIDPNVDATGETTVELDATINAGPAGIVLVLSDDDGTQFNYGWFGLEPGSYVLTAPIDSGSGQWVSAVGGTPGLDLTLLSFIHIQVDPGTHTGPYSVSYNNLQLIPEPASVALLGGAAGLFVTRRRGRA